MKNTRKEDAIAFMNLYIHKVEEIRYIPFVFFLIALFFVNVQPASSADDRCSQVDVDCRGPVVPPFFYRAGADGNTYPSNAQAAAEKRCSHLIEEYNLCSCDVTYIAQFQEGSYEGEGAEGSSADHLIRWRFGVEYHQSFSVTVPGAIYKLTSGSECQYESDYPSIIVRGRVVDCPVGYSPNSTTNREYCYKTLDILSKPIQDKTCKIGNPILIGSGNKQQVEADYQSDTLKFVRTYNSDATDVVNGESVGSRWRHNYDRYLSVPPLATGSAYALRQDGITNHFVLENGVVVEATMNNDDLEQDDAGWRYITASDETELYDDTGRLVSITNLTGRTQTITYDNTGRLIEVRDDAGRTLTFTYDSEGSIASMTDPEERVYTYEHDGNGNLVKVIYPDTTPGDQTDNPSRTYLYEDTRFPQALTGITDENNNRFATWTYDAQGRAISSEHAGGVDKTTLTYNANGTTTVTNPLGKQTTYHFVDIQGYRYVGNVEGHPTNYCAGANKAYSYDTNGNVISKTDWNGVTTTYTYDMTRNLELSRTEAVGTPQARTITTEWHAQFRLPTKITEPDRITEYSYDANGRQLSSRVSSNQ